MSTLWVELFIQFHFRLLMSTVTHPFDHYIISLILLLRVQRSPPPSAATTAVLVRLAHLAGAIAGRHRLRLGLKRHAVTPQRTTARWAVFATSDPCRTAAIQPH